MATHSSILAWRISWTEEFGWLPAMGLKRVRHNGVTNTHTHTHSIFTELSDALGNKDYNENVRALLLRFPNPASVEKRRPP